MTTTSADNAPLALIVDDEADLCLLMQMTLQRMGVKSIVAANVSEAKQKLACHRFQLCLTDLNMPQQNGIELVRYIHQQHPSLPVAVISAYGSIETAIEALKAGAFDFVTKPIQHTQLKALLTQALATATQSNSTGDLHIDDQLLISQSPIMYQLKQTLRKLSRSQAPVFISGESGSGKEVVARLIHHMSNRKDGAFVPVNCGAIAHDLIESELFGHKKGSFTGAHQDKIGLFQAAHGGTLFLDEIADLPLTIQVKLLRAIQEKTIRPLGSEHEVNVDIRILTATHKNLSEMVNQGKFRQDLYFRIHVIDVHIPPLRERGDDILLLAEHFLKQICHDWQLAPLHISPEAKTLLRQGYYAGNVRELRNIIERAVTLCDGQLIDIKDIQDSVQLTPPSTISQQHDVESEIAQTQYPATANLPNEGLESYLANIEKNILVKALESSHWNRTLAAKKLGMSFRSMRYRLKKFGLDVEDE